MSPKLGHYRNEHSRHRTGRWEGSQNYPWNVEWCHCGEARARSHISDRSNVWPQLYKVTNMSWSSRYQEQANNEVEVVDREIGEKSVCLSAKVKMPSSLVSDYKPCSICSPKHNISITARRPDRPCQTLH